MKAAQLLGLLNLAASSVQGHGLPPLQESRPYQSFFEPLVAGDQKASLATLSLQLHRFGHLEGFLAWEPSLLFGVRHIDGTCGWGPTLWFSASSICGPASIVQLPMLGVGGERLR